MFTGVLQPPISLFSLSYARSLPFWPLEMSNHISNEIDTKLVVKRRPAGTRHAAAAETTYTYPEKEKRGIARARRVPCTCMQGRRMGINVNIKA
jgi:hypothetical protein